MNPGCEASRYERNDGNPVELCGRPAPVRVYCMGKVIMRQCVHHGGLLASMIGAHGKEKLLERYRREIEYE